MLNYAKISTIFLHSLKHICYFIFIILMINFGNTFIILYDYIGKFIAMHMERVRERERETIVDNHDQRQVLLAL